MNPLRWSFRSRYLAGFLACAGLLAYALYVQFVEGLMPCEFCILQRIAFAALGGVFLVGGLHAPKAKAGRRVYTGLASLAALAGAVVAGRHLWVQLFPPEIPTCGAGLEFRVAQQGWLGAIQKVLTASGDCSMIDWTFLGLGMPGWTLLWYLGLGLWAVLAVRAPRKSS
ncbi:disulfide bond formation protein B [Lysobacteraceae bacterium NML75-0749]|nr:disulfide bond formation protein B [Xanthomonadaceae bacterium NML91-0268]PJK03594.1 disulfide bond formation protein B [Xanthomonadaceae bacterium NML75-0749]